MRRLRYSARLLRELVAFARAHKVYWIVPLVVVLALFVVLVFVSEASSPLVYTLF